MRSIAAFALVLALCGCSGTSGAYGGGSGTASGTAPGTVSSAPAATTPSATTSVPASGSGAVTAQEICTFLEQEAPKLESIGTTVGALAQFVGDLAQWASQHPGFDVRDTAGLDTGTSQQCPQARERILKAIGKDRFSGSL